MMLCPVLTSVSVCKGNFSCSVSEQGEAVAEANTDRGSASVSVLMEFPRPREKRASARPRLGWGRVWGRVRHKANVCP